MVSASRLSVTARDARDAAAARGRLDARRGRRRARAGLLGGGRRVRREPAAVEHPRAGWPSSRATSTRPRRCSPRPGIAATRAPTPCWPRSSRIATPTTRCARCATRTWSCGAGARSASRRATRSRSAGRRRSPSACGGLAAPTRPTARSRRPRPATRAPTCTCAVSAAGCGSPAATSRAPAPTSRRRPRASCGWARCCSARSA